MFLLREAIIWAGITSECSKWSLLGLVESFLRVVDFVLVLGGRAGVRGRHLPVDRRWDVTAVLVVVGQRQVQEAGACGQVDVLHVFHL